MENNYDRVAMLHDAMIQKETDLEELAERLGMSEEEVEAGLSGADQVNHIAKVSDALGIEEAYFWGGMRFDENGKLVNL